MNQYIDEQLNDPMIAWTLSGQISLKHGRTYRASAILHKINEHGGHVFEKQFGDAHESFLTIEEAFTALADKIKRWKDDALQAERKSQSSD